MKILNVTIPVETRDGARWRLRPIGDPHIDVKAHNTRRFKKHIQAIAADPHSVAVCIGDTFNGSLPGHKYFSTKALKGDIPAQLDDYVNEMIERGVLAFAPVAEAGVPLIMMRGNHDKWVKGVDVVRMLVEQLNLRFPDTAKVQYGGSEALISVKAGGLHHWRIFASHGAGGGYTPGGKVTRFANTVPHIADADFYLRGHVHDADVRVLERVYVNDRGDFHKRPVTYITTNSFCSERSAEHEDYSAEQSLPPIDNRIQVIEVINPSSKGAGDLRTHQGRVYVHDAEY